MYREIKKCRICGNSDLIPVLNLGNQFLTGIFPKSRNEKVASGPLELIKCSEGDRQNGCGLLQLRHSYDLNGLYGDNYGYRSGLNKAMVDHLDDKVKKALRYVKLLRGDIVVDIGSNDGTLLKAYLRDDIILVGCDPAGNKFKKHYPANAALLCDFFSSEILRKKIGRKNAKIISSIAMFYDLESPLEFMDQIYEILSDEGVWIFEQSYMPAMLKMNAYDTVCHEHLEYYRLKQIKMMTDKVGFKIIDVEVNDSNGGSISLVAAKRESIHKECGGILKKILRDEESLGLNTLKPYECFRKRVFEHRERLPAYIKEIKKGGKDILGYGASTKGNVILQFCNLTEKEIPFIAEVNADKFNAFTPGTLIPIVAEDRARAMKPAYFMVLPWHFKENIIRKERDYLKSGGRLLFPLPNPETVKA